MATTYSIKSLKDALDSGEVLFGDFVSLSTSALPFEKEYYVSEEVRLHFEVSGILTGLAEVYIDKRRSENSPIAYRLSIGNEVIIEDGYAQVSVRPHRP